jgi:spore coat polysaccharide biosynthesis predicted glycosyltransferase SpsG
MRLVFLAEASPDIGSGHVMRSSAIAEDAILSGIDCVFVGSISNINWLEGRISGLGFSKISHTKDFVSNPESDVLILDSYTIELSNSFIQPERWNKIVLIADSVTPQYLADLVIHPGLDGSWYSGDSTRFLFGSEFIPLRKSINRKIWGFSAKTERIVVFGGGTDPFNFAFEIANELRNLDGFSSVKFFSNDESKIPNLDTRFEVSAFGSELDRTIESADLIFTTASTSALEVIARGIPVGIANAVLNQDEFYQTAGKLGLASPIGQRVSSGNWVFDAGLIARLIKDPLYRSNLVQKCSGVIDFQGATRIVAAISGLQN